MTGLGNRHMRDFDPDQVRELHPVQVCVCVDPSAAQRVSVQHTVWMIVQLLARLEGVVSAVGVDVPAVALVERVTPPDWAQEDLRETLISVGEGLNAVPVSRADARVPGALVLQVGPGCQDADLYLHGEAWTAHVATTPLPKPGRESPLPFGPYLAACLGTGWVFRYVVLPGADLEQLHFGYSLWGWEQASDFPSGEPTRLDAALDLGLAGAGAVGTGLMQTLWACPGVGGEGVVADNDKDGITVDNLNRCVPFMAGDIGDPKASTAAARLASADLSWTPVDATFSREEIGRIPETVVSAVDRNRSRDAVQGLYPPSLWSASTHGLRAELLHCGPPGEGACLRCFNLPEKPLPDSVAAAQLRELDDTQLFELATAHQLDVDVLRAWRDDPECATVDEHTLTELQDRFGAHASSFSVGFVSVAAGVMLAAAVVQEAADPAVLLGGQGNRVLLQQRRLINVRNGTVSFYARDSACPRCDPDTPAVDVWRRRRHAPEGDRTSHRREG